MRNGNMDIYGADLSGLIGHESQYQKKAQTLSLSSLASTNITKANDLLTQANDLISKAKAKNLDTSSCEKLVNEANDLMTEAKTVMANPIYANNLALKAIERLKAAIDCLKASG